MKAQTSGDVRTHVVLPGSLVKEIDELVGARKRSAFFADLAQAEVRRLKLLKFLDNMRKNGPAWKDKDHPELVKLGTAEYVRRGRQSKSARQKWIAKHWYDRK